MTEPSVDVDTQALYDRADALEKMIEELTEAEPPEYTDPDPPCNLQEAKDAVKQLKRSADSVRTYMKTGYEEWGHLAESLRTAAQSYEEVDEDAARALSTLSGSVSPATLGPADAGGPHEAGPALDLPSDDIPDTQTPQGPAPVALLNDTYQDSSDLCGLVEAGDGGRSCDDFAEAWRAYGGQLFDATLRCFVPFPSDSWEGEAAEAANQSLEEQRQWSLGMKDNCDQMALWAEQLSTAQSWLLDTHILYDGHELHQRIEVEEIEHDYAALDDRIVPHRPKRKKYSQKLADLQTLSDEVLAQIPNAGRHAAINRESFAGSAWLHVLPALRIRAWVLAHAWFRPSGPDRHAQCRRVIDTDRCADARGLTGGAGGRRLDGGVGG